MIENKGIKTRTIIKNNLFYFIQISVSLDFFRNILETYCSLFRFIDEKFIRSNVPLMIIFIRIYIYKYLYKKYDIKNHENYKHQNYYL